MKLQHCFLFVCAVWFSSNSWAEPGGPLVYINENLGFHVEGYNYSQSEFPCDIDKSLVEQIIQRGAEENLRIEPVGTKEKLQNGRIPVLAMDIESLVLGSEEFTFGTDSQSTMPHVGVRVALVAEHLSEGFNTAEHSCSILTPNDLVPTTSVLDMGTYGYTVCSAIRKKCLNRLSNDIVQWVLPQISE